MPRPTLPEKSTTVTRWVPFITNVLAFIGLWQILSNSAAILSRWF